MNAKQVPHFVLGSIEVTPFLTENFTNKKTIQQRDGATKEAIRMITAGLTKAYDEHQAAGIDAQHNAAEKALNEITTRYLDMSGVYQKIFVVICGRMHGNEDNRTFSFTRPNPLPTPKRGPLPVELR